MDKLTRKNTSQERGTTAALLLAIAVVISSAPPVRAFELFGMRFFEGKTEQEQSTVIDPQLYSVSFQIASEDKRLRTQLQAATALYSRRAQPASGEAGLIAMARGDYRRVLAALYNAGYYAGVIHIRIEGNEASDLPVSVELPELARVEITIDPGPIFAFGAVGFKNPPPLGADTGGIDASGFETGEPARAGVIGDAGDASIEAWRQAGYPKAGVAERLVFADHDRQQLDATLVLDPGGYARFGVVTISGTEAVDPEFVRYMADLPVGQQFDPEAVRDAENRLAKLNVFQSVRVVEGDEIEADGTLPFVIEVQDRKPRRFGVGATISSLDGIGLEGFWLHRNLLGRAERLRVEGSVLGLGRRDDALDLDYQAGISFQKPGVLSPDTLLTSTLFARQEVLETYRERSLTGTIGLANQIDAYTKISLIAELSRAEFDDGPGSGKYTTASLIGRGEYDRRDSETDAKRGYYISLDLQPFHEFENDNTAVRGILGLRYYRPLDEDARTVIAGRFRLGTIFGGVRDELPNNLLFFSGGGGSVRGYPYRSNGIEIGGDIVGGRSMMETSLELRTEITDTIGIVGFADAGLVSASGWPGQDGDLRVGVGAGIRYQTGLGPIRFDVAVPLDRQTNQPKVAFYIGIGQAF